MKIKKYLKLNQAGFGHFEAVIAIAVIAMVGVVGVYISKHNNSHAAPLNTTSGSTSDNIVYCNSAADKSGNAIYSVNSSGTDVVALNSSSGCANGNNVTWAKNGSEVYYTNFANYDSIVKVSSTGTGTTIIATPESGVFIDSLTYNETTQKLAYSTGSDTAIPEIGILNSNGTGLKILKTYAIGTNIGSLQWSPNGQYLVYSTFNTKKQVSTTSLIDTSGNVTVISNSTTTPFFGIGDHGSWSSNSAKIVGLESVGANQNIVTYKVATKTFSTITTSGVYDNVAWSPDGTMFAATEPSGSNNSLVIMDSDGSNQQTLDTYPMATNTYGSNEIDWAPNSNEVAYLYNGALYTVSTSAKTPIEVAGASVNVDSFDWSIQ